MPDFTITITDADAALLTDLATTEGTDVQGLIALKSVQLVDFRKRAVQKAVLASRIAKLGFAGPVVLNALDNVAIPGGTTVEVEVTKALGILGRR